MTDLASQLNAQAGVAMGNSPRSRPAGLTDQQIDGIQRQGADGVYRGPQQQNIDENGRVVTVGQDKTMGGTVAFLNGALGEWGDELAGASMAAGAYVGGQPGSFSDNKRVFTDEARRQEDLILKTNPVAANALYATGIVTGVASGAGVAAKTGLKMASTVGGRMAQGGGAGALSGAATGAGDSDKNSEVLRDGGVGAGVGLVTGAVATPLLEGAVRVGKPLVKKALSAFSKQGNVPKENNVANELALEAMSLDGDTPQDLLARLAEAKYTNKDATISDVAGENLAALSEWAFGSAGKAKQKAAKMYAERESGALGRFMADLRDNLSDGTAFSDTFDEVVKRRADEAAPLYREAYAQEPALSGVMESLLKRPSIAAAWPAAKRLAAEEGKELPQTLEIIDGDIILRSAPDWETWHYIQRGLRDVARSESSNNGATDYSRKVGGTLKELLREMDDLNPAYAKARKTYSDESTTLDAMEAGLGILKGETDKADSLFEVTVKNIKAMSDAERESYRLGAARALLGVAYRPLGERRIARNIVRDPRIRQKLRAAWDDPGQADAFLDRIHAELKMADRANQITGNSRTTPREQMRTRAEAARGPSVSGAAGVAEDLGNINAGSAIRKIIGRRSDRASPGEIVDRASSLTPLFEADPQVRAQFVNRLAQAANNPYGPRLPDARAYRAPVGVPAVSGVVAAPVVNDLLRGR